MRPSESGISTYGFSSNYFTIYYFTTAGIFECVTYYFTTYGCSSIYFTIYYFTTDGFFFDYFTIYYFGVRCTSATDATDRSYGGRERGHRCEERCQNETTRGADWLTYCQAAGYFTIYCFGVYYFHIHF